ncbi:MAG: outer membrane lipoprotein-sorting protein, partial [Candidatus Marinimicrobia bacterium]|nr:outer membrane lipoprotein-sorting protein [Candidatus Neomarinimicrobiota bacterium]
MITKKLILSLFTFSLVFAQSGDEIAKKMESVRTPKDMKSNSTLILTNAKGKTQNKTIRSLSADDNKKQIIWFLAPARDKGVAFLKLENESGDDEMKLWLP